MRYLACLFFILLTTRAPTVISHLSVGDHAMDEEGFQRTMRYIFTFIEKVRTLCRTAPSTHSTQLNNPPRKNKQKASLRSYANASGSAKTLANGATSRSVSRYYLLSLSVP